MLLKTMFYDKMPTKLNKHSRWHMQDINIQFTIITRSNPMVHYLLFTFTSPSLTATVCIIMGFKFAVSNPEKQYIRSS